MPHRFPHQVETKVVSRTRIIHFAGRGWRAVRGEALDSRGEETWSFYLYKGYDSLFCPTRGAPGMILGLYSRVRCVTHLRRLSGGGWIWNIWLSRWYVRLLLLEYIVEKGIGVIMRCSFASHLLRIKLQ